MSITGVAGIGLTHHERGGSCGFNFSTCACLRFRLDSCAAHGRSQRARDLASSNGRSATIISSRRAKQLLYIDRWFAPRVMKESAKKPIQIFESCAARAHSQSARDLATSIGRFATIISSWHAQQLLYIDRWFAARVMQENAKKPIGISRQHCGKSSPA